MKIKLAVLLLFVGASAFGTLSCPPILLAEAYPHLFHPSDDYFVGQALKAAGGPLLDLGSATGRIIEMALVRGIPALGIEVDRFLANYAVAEMGRYFGENFSVLVADYTEVTLPRGMGVITSMANSWPMVKDRNTRRHVLAAIYESLKDNGRFVLSLNSERVFTRDSSRPIERWLDTYPDPIFYRMLYREDPEKLLRTYDLALSRRRTRENHSFSSAIISVAEMRQDLSEAKFKIVAAYGDYPLKSTSGGIEVFPSRPDSFYQIYLLSK